MPQLQADTDDKLDCSTRVITPENIAFEYALAGPFQRLPAFLFDIGVRVAFFIAMIFVFSAILPFLPFGLAFANIGMLIGFFALSWFYGVFFEARFNGRTLGKMVFKLRTISIDGRPINASQAALRNILRLADMNVLLSLQMFGSDFPPMFLFPTMLVGFITMMATRRMQRIGDIAAGTMVVAEGRRSTPWNLQPEDLRAFGLAELIPLNYQPSASLAQTIGLYMENRRRLNPLRRNDVAKHLALPLIKRFGLLSDTSPDLLLCALYVRTFMPQGQQEEGRERMRVLQSRRGQQQQTGTTMLSPGKVTPVATIPNRVGSEPPAVESPSVEQAATSSDGTVPTPSGTDDRSDSTPT